MSHALRIRKPEDDSVDNFFAQLYSEVFKDQFDRAFFRFPVNDHFEIHPLRSKRLVHAVIRWNAQERKTIITRRQAHEQIDFAEAFADENQVEMSNRSGWGDGGTDLCVDLGDSKWQAVRVSNGQWELMTNPPVHFYRFAHQQSLPTPDREGDIRELLPHLPQLVNPHDQLLLLAWVATAWLPIPRPILTLVGTHGAAKSTMTAFIRRVLDPSRAELLGKDARGDLPLTFHKHAIAAFDNVDDLTPAEADLFCQAITGRAIARRQLYTDGEEFILAFRRAVIINGLRLPTNRPDLLDRVLPLELERISPERRLSSRQVEVSFEQARPRIVGGIFNTLAQAMALLPSVPDKGLGRMADFHHWGRAVAIAVGQTIEEFDAAYQMAEGRQKRGAADNTLAQAILLFAKEAHSWEGSPSELYKRLSEVAKEGQLPRNHEFWPESHLGLSRALKQLGETLADHGVAVSALRRTKTRRIQITYDPTADRLSNEE